MTGCQRQQRRRRRRDEQKIEKERGRDENPTKNCWGLWVLADQCYSMDVYVHTVSRSLTPAWMHSSCKISIISTTAVKCYAPDILKEYISHVSQGTGQTAEFCCCATISCLTGSIERFFEALLRRLRSKFQNQNMIQL